MSSNTPGAGLRASSGPTGGGSRAPGGGDETAALKALRDVAHRTQAEGLVVGSAGNVSVRLAPDTMAISPTGWELRDLGAADFVRVRLDGPEPDAGEDPQGIFTESGPDANAQSPLSRPSSEWQLHRALYRLRPDVGAVVHTHSPRATALATLERSVPPIHYYLALLGGEVPLVPYAPYGSQALATWTADALRDRPAQAALLAHHGAIAVGRTPAEAFLRAEILEHLADLYLTLRATGLEIPLLTPEQLREASSRISAYPHHDPSSPGPS